MRADSSSPGSAGSTLSTWLSGTGRLTSTANTCARRPAPAQHGRYGEQVEAHVRRKHLRAHIFRLAIQRNVCFYMGEYIEVHRLLLGMATMMARPGSERAAPQAACLQRGRAPLHHAACRAHTRGG